MLATQGRAVRAALFVAYVVSWWTALAVIGITFGLLAYRLLAERGRRKTLEAAFRAPANTVIALGEGPGGPKMWIWVGEGQQPTQASTRIWICHRAGMRARSRRQT